ncbi:MAG: hypothetical protein K6U87_08915 [Firmicutes bacterium]|nr:hypothetical protein [Bacillota bacterium]
MAFAPIPSIHPSEAAPTAAALSLALRPLFARHLGAPIRCGPVDIGHGDPVEVTGAVEADCAHGFVLAWQGPGGRRAAFIAWTDLWASQGRVQIRGGPLAGPVAAALAAIPRPLPPGGARP